MESVGWLLLPLVIGITIFFIYTIRKIDSEEDTTFTTPTTPVPPPPVPPTPIPVKDVSVESAAQKYIPIYEYKAPQTVKRCAHCDGENACDTTVCCICGNNIDS